MSTVTATSDVFMSFVSKMIPISRGKETGLSLIVALTGRDYTPDFMSHKSISDVTDEVVGNGYVRQTLTGLKKDESVPGKIILSANNVLFEANGGQWGATRWVMYEADADGTLVAAGLINESREDDTVITDGNQLELLFEPGFLILERAE